MLTLVFSCLGMMALLWLIGAIALTRQEQNWPPKAPPGMLHIHFCKRRSE